MKHLLLKYALFFFVLPFSQAQNVFQLAPPYLQYESVFFEKAATVKLEFAQADTKIHYTVNGQEPSERDPVYTKPIRIKKNHTTLKARVFGIDFLPSEVVAATFYKQGLAIESISTTLAHERYPGSGKTALIDGKGGNKSLSSNTWMGFQADTVLLMITLTKPQKAKQVMLHVLQNQGAWIFLPQKAEVYGAKNGSNEWVLLGQQSFETSKKAEKDQCRAIFLDLEKCPKTTQIILKIYPVASLPEWHPGKGNAAWLFMDEVKLY
ncbi:MAG: FN3 associated domain-containing protein [Saprospiraceae bacterium]